VPPPPPADSYLQAGDWSGTVTQLKTHPNRTHARTVPAPPPATQVPCHRDDGTVRRVARVKV
jgi:hypothetical protein